MKSFKSVAIAITLVLVVSFAIEYMVSSESNNNSKGNIPIDTTISSSMDICPKNLGNVTLEDLGIITEAEDEYWEIEQIGDLYYRVRREDYERDYQGKYEYDEEELIGDINDLYHYSKVSHY